MRIGGIVLCGGRSSRMGRPKAWLPVGDELMLQRVVRILREVVDPVVAVAAPGQDVPPLPAEVQVVRDQVEGKGPLGGLAAGLAALEGRADAAYLSSCDVPLLKPGFVRAVIASLGDAAIAVPDVNGFKHPLAAVYRNGVLSEVRRLVALDRLRPVHLFDLVATRFIAAAELPELSSLTNVNTEDEYRTIAEAERPGIERQE